MSNGAPSTAHKKARGLRSGLFAEIIIIFAMVGAALWVGGMFMLGGGFGAIKGLIGATLVFLAFSLVYDTFYGSGARRPDWLSDARTYPLLNASGKAISEFVDEQRAQKPAESDPAA